MATTKKVRLRMYSSVDELLAWNLGFKPPSCINQAWWHTPAILELQRWRWKNQFRRLGVHTLSIHWEKHSNTCAEWCDAARAEEECQLAMNISRHASICGMLSASQFPPREIFISHQGTLNHLWHLPSWQSSSYVPGELWQLSGMWGPALCIKTPFFSGLTVKFSY